MQDIINKLPSEFGKEIIVGLIVAFTLKILYRIASYLYSRLMDDKPQSQPHPQNQQTYQKQMPAPQQRQHQPGFHQTGSVQPQYANPYPLQQSMMQALLMPQQQQYQNQANWALALAIVSFFLWFSIPVLAIPALAMSIQWGFKARRLGTGKLALSLSCFQVLGVLCMIVVIFAMAMYNPYYPYYYSY